MNAESFQLKQSPFRAGVSAYNGPQQLALAGGVKRAFVASDSVLTLSGPVGVGKTASILTALERSGNDCVIARIGRVMLAREDVLELVLNELRIDQMPASALKRFTTLQKMLSDWAAAGTEVFLVVEDVERIGIEGLAELESLTAAEDGASPGAHLILMGTVDMRQFLEHEKLARLKQRVVRNMNLEAFSVDETRGYIEHRLAQTDTNLDIAFDLDAIEIVHGCSTGVPRLINTVAETMLLCAGESGVMRVTRAVARQVAADEFGYQHGETVVTPAISAETSIDSSRTDPAAAGLSQGSINSPSANDEYPDTSAENAAPAARQSTTDSDEEILIQDTQPPMPAIDMAEETSPPIVAPKSSNEALTRAQEVESWKQKTDATQPSLPVLKGASSDEPGKEEKTDAPSQPGEASSAQQADASIAKSDPEVAPAVEAARAESKPAETLRENSSKPKASPPAEATNPAEVAGDSELEVDAAEPLASTVPVKDTKPDEEIRIQLEPKAPQPLNAEDDNGDTQTKQALDDALRPDTQLLRSLDEEDIPVEDDGPIPIGLIDDNDSAAKAAVADSPTDANTVDARSGPDAESPLESAAKEASNDELSLEDTNTSKPQTPAEKAEVPEITLDASLDDKQKQAQERLAEDARRRKEAAADDASAETDDDKSNDAEAENGDDESAQKQKELVESLSARFSGAKSLEDVVDDKAAETLFGEEFTEMAAAVAAMASAQNLDLGDDNAAEENPEGSDDAVSQDAGPAATSDGELSLVAEEPPPATTDPAPEASPASEPAKPAAAAAKPTPAASPAAAADSKNLDSSPSQRLKMVRALSGKSGSPPVPVSGTVGEEIVLGNSSRLKVDKSAGAKGSPKPHKPVKGPDTNGEFDYIKDDEPDKKKGFLSRFRR